MHERGSITWGVDIDQKGEFPMELGCFQRLTTTHDGTQPHLTAPGTLLAVEIIYMNNRLSKLEKLLLLN